MNASDGVEFVVGPIFGRGRQVRAALARRLDCALLVSAPGFGELGNWSIYACSPRTTIEARAAQWRLIGDWPGDKPAEGLDLFSTLRCLFQPPQSVLVPMKSKINLPENAPFNGGWIGFLGYELASQIEKLPNQWPRASVVPDLFFGYYDTFVLHRLADNAYWAVATDRFGMGDARGRLDQLLSYLDASPGANEVGPLVSAPPRSDCTQEQYIHRIERILEYIHAGDIFQANYTHRFSAKKCDRADWVETLAARCWDRSQAPFAALLRGGAGDHCWSIVSTSPERFLSLSPTGKVETRPIKGTRPRAVDVDRDHELALELVHSPKDRAELAMIVDLERNDLGRVCEYKSIQVMEHARLESFSNVHHLVSIIVGQLRPGKDLVDLFRATFPGGSVTGAPKIRAMQIIDELEWCRRGVYTGALGYVSDHGRADFNIPIRTIVVEPNSVHYHVGGGIVADSDPLLEYQESLAKGQRLRAALLDE